jgi:predicted peroxiredoxin
MKNNNETTKKLLIVMSNADPLKPDSCYAPMFQATVAAALSIDVEIILTGISVQLAVNDNAEKVEVNLESHRTIYDLIKQAHDAGVSFKACNTSLDIAGEKLLDEIEERVGAAYVINEAMDENTVTFTY